jgi:uncharacterized membrane-anchored protein
MEEQIKQISTRVRTAFGYFWLLPILLVILGETGGDWIGMYADDVRATFFAETITILLVAICIPVSLKLFSWVLAKKIDLVAISQALRLYALWSGVRLAILAMPVLAGFLTYYMALSNKGLLCALIGLTASLFCFPSEERLRKELHIDKENKE